MDPEQILIDASEHLRHSGCREEAAECLANYFLWRLRGGFEPTHGDQRATELLMQLGTVADVLSESLQGS